METTTVEALIDMSQAVIKDARAFNARVAALQSINADLVKALEMIARANQYDVERGQSCAEEMRNIAQAALAKAGA